MGRCARLGVAFGAASAIAVGGFALWLASEPESVTFYPPPFPEAEAPSGLFANGFGFVVLGFGVLVGLAASVVSRFSRGVRSVAARLGVGVACVVGVGAGLWVLTAGALIPALAWAGGAAVFWALVFAAEGAILLGVSVAGLCRVARRRDARPQTHYSG